jgi:peptidoglycan/xylan/chitin deacetylase (PgdA/CDA1 family)
MRRLTPLLLLIVAGVTVALVVTGKGGRGHARAQPASTTKSKAPPAKPRIVHGPHRDPVPILMYHVVSAPRPGAPYPELYTPAPVFRAQMHALARRGYHGVTLHRVDEYWRRGYALPPRPIVLSFDDGYLSDYTHARPVLRSLGWPGVLNLEVNNVRSGDLTAREVRGLIRAGWEVDSHTLTHPDLRTLTDAELRRELVDSRAFIRRHFHVPASYFCYPAGRYDARVVAAVRAAGYRAATTTQPGLARPGARFTLDRIRVNASDGVSGLLAHLAHLPERRTGAPPRGGSEIVRTDPLRSPARAMRAWGRRP